jgi:hypothetical protein
VAILLRVVLACVYDKYGREGAAAMLMETRAGTGIFLTLFLCHTASKGMQVVEDEE